MIFRYPFIYISYTLMDSVVMCQLHLYLVVLVDDYYSHILEKVYMSIHVNNGTFQVISNLLGTYF